MAVRSHIIIKAAHAETWTVSVQQPFKGAAHVNEVKK